MTGYRQILWGFLLVWGQAVASPAYLEVTPTPFRHTVITDGTEPGLRLSLPPETKITLVIPDENNLAECEAFWDQNQWWVRTQVVADSGGCDIYLIGDTGDIHGVLEYRYYIE